MLLLGLILLPLVFADVNELTINDYVIRIDGDKLKNVVETAKSLEVLDLSSLGLHRVDKSAFKNVTNLQILNLGNNSFQGPYAPVPPRVFSNLKNLQSLSLADNNLKHFYKAFTGLSNLKFLNISNNPVTAIGPGEWSGLSKSVDVFTHGNAFIKIFTSLFENVDSQVWFKERSKVEELLAELDEGKVKPWWQPKHLEAQDFNIKMCTEHGKVKLLESMEKDEHLPVGCSEVFTAVWSTLLLDDYNITEFDQGWYRFNPLPGKPIGTLTLRNNSIAHLTAEIMNNLPESISEVDLSGNKIEMLQKGILKNPNIRILVLNRNLMKNVEDHALENVTVRYLLLNDNLMNDTKFIATLPRSMQKLYLNKNQISELTITPNFELPLLTTLELTENQIAILRKNSLRSFPYLFVLDLSRNRLSRLEPGCFEGVQYLHWLKLRNNEIAHLDEGIFDGLTRLRNLDLGRNKLTTVSERFRDSLPHNLLSLHVDYNSLDKLEAASFVNVPKNVLNLRGNNISTIAKGSFYVANLYGLDLEHEASDDSKLFGSTFPAYDAILLHANPVRPKLKGIGNVILSGNPIKRLENGAFFGVRKEEGDNFIYVSECPIDLIQGGLFDEV